MPRKSQSKKSVVSTLANQAMKRRWLSLSKTIADASYNEASDFDRKWEAVADVIFSTPPLYLAGGFPHETAFFKEFLKVERSTGIRKARVARVASAADIELYGDTKIDAVLDYLERKTGGPLKSRLPVALSAVRIPVGEKGGAVRQVSLAEATREQIRAATRALRNANAEGTKASPQATAIARALSAAGLKGIDVVVHRDGFDLRGIPFASLDKLARTLRSVKLPPATKDE
jgi:hypothetical protein